MTKSDMVQLKVKIGKVVGGSTYVHETGLELCDNELIQLVKKAQFIVTNTSHVNVFRIDQSERTVSLLYYPDFFEVPFPELVESWKVYIDEGRFTFRTYRESTNPPILHRKELLIPSNHPAFSIFSELTNQAEQIGLFSDTTLIGFKNNWISRIEEAGYLLNNNTFQPIGNETKLNNQVEYPVNVIERHKTALTRYGLSAPIQTLARNGLIRDELTYFDYGCGRGDDLSGLKKLGLIAQGWDPHFSPNSAKTLSDIVNLGFVVNVIENFDERLQAIRGAYELAEKLLVVSVMLYTNVPINGRRYGDGYITQRNTFQKYFTQSELKEFVEGTLNTEAIPVAPGIVYIFKDKLFEQEYLFARQRNKHTLRLLGYRKEKQPRELRQRKQTKNELLADKNSELIDGLWNVFLELGRTPEVHETSLSNTAIAEFGSWSKVVRFILEIKDIEDLTRVSNSHKNDLLVYLALQQFVKRRPYKSLESKVQKEIKFHFGDYGNGIAQSQLLFSKIANVKELDMACRDAAEQGLGYYVDSDFLQLHSSLIERLPPLLRIYIGCGTAIYGTLENIDLVKIHVRSSKVSLMKYDDFHGKEIPRLVERIKITLKNQIIDIYEYGEEFTPTLLYFKSKYINEDFGYYEQQLKFDEQLKQLNLVGQDEYGPSEIQFSHALKSIRKEISNYNIKDSSTIPDLNEKCGANFTYRDFIECGETWNQKKVENTPQSAESFNALYDLAINILDPIIEYFGSIKLTYGFASAALTKHIKLRIAPALDQHSAFEVNTRGKRICTRDGAACDFIVEDENSFEVAKWILQELDFDRMYLYGPDRPIHISFSKAPLKAITLMKLSKEGKLYPKQIQNASELEKLSLEN